jgi:hypothetical protein
MAKIPSLSLRFSFKGCRLHEKSEILYLVDLKSSLALAENHKLIFGSRRKPNGRSIRQLRSLFNGNDCNKYRATKSDFTRRVNS